jgi:hypothetical protein
MLQVAGVTIEDDLELSRRAKVEAEKQAAAQADWASKERKAEEVKRREEEQEGEHSALDAVD